MSPACCVGRRTASRHSKQTQDELAMARAPCRQRTTRVGRRVFAAARGGGQRGAVGALEGARRMVGARRFELPTPCTPCIPGPPARILRSGWKRNGLVRESENRPQVRSGRRESQGVALGRAPLRRLVVVDALTWQSYQVTEEREEARCHSTLTRSHAQDASRVQRPRQRARRPRSVRGAG